MKRDSLNPHRLLEYKIIIIGCQAQKNKGEKMSENSPQKGQPKIEFQIRKELNEIVQCDDEEMMERFNALAKTYLDDSNRLTVVGYKEDSIF